MSVMVNSEQRKTFDSIKMERVISVELRANDQIVKAQKHEIKLAVSSPTRDQPTSPTDLIAPKKKGDDNNYKNSSAKMQRWLNESPEDEPWSSAGYNGKPRRSKKEKSNTE
ncbi:hypothetical protein MMC28_001482 [Mycoblastus sanguinarius]|nr:hypothetical protein [Mycoblastus sanguinarius]